MSPHVVTKKKLFFLQWELLRIRETLVFLSRLTIYSVTLAAALSIRVVVPGEGLPWWDSGEDYRAQESDVEAGGQSVGPPAEQRLCGWAYMCSRTQTL